MKNYWILLTGILWLMAGCASTEEPQPPETEADQTSGLAPVIDEGGASPTDTEIPAPDSGNVIEPSLKNLVQQAKDDLAQRLSVELDLIELLEAKSVVWPDASLGCPQPGMVYKQVPEDGALIILRVEGILYEYHTGGSRGLFLCEKVTKDTYAPPQIDITNLTPSALDKNNPTPDKGIPPNEDN